MLAVLSDVLTRYLAAGGHNVVFDETITFWDKKLWDNKVQITVEDSDTFSNDTLGDGEVDVDQLRLTGKLSACACEYLHRLPSRFRAFSLVSLALVFAGARPLQQAHLCSLSRPFRNQTPDSSVPLCLDFCVFYILLTYSL